MARDSTYPPIPPTQSGMKNRCPRCGRGRLFAGFLTVAPSCTACGLDYTFIDTGDGPAVFAIFIVGTLGMAGVLFFEFGLGLPLWLNLTVMISFIVLASLVMLRQLKGFFIAQQYRMKAAEGRLDAPENTV